MEKDHPHFPKEVRSYMLRTLKKVFVYFIALNYVFTSSLSSMSLDIIERAPTTHVNLSEDINGNTILTADGNIKIRKFTSPGNLLIRTPGIVIFAEEGHVGAFLDVEAQDIILSKGVKLKGKASHLHAHEKMQILGSFESEEDTTLKADQQLDLWGALTSLSGTLDFYGAQFNNGGDVEAFKGIRGNIEHFKNYNLLRTKGNFLLQTNIFENNFDANKRTGARIFAFGLLKIDTAESYYDAGEIYSPLLTMISASSIQFSSTHKFYGNEADIRANTIDAEKGAQFFFQNTLHFCSKLGNFTHYGDVTQIESGLFPCYKDYFPSRRLPVNLLIPDLDALTEAIHLKEYNIIQDAISRIRKGPSRVALCYNVKGDFDRKGNDICLSGTPAFQVNGKMNSDKHLARSGIFTTDNVLIQAALLALKNTSIKSYGSAHLISRGNANFDEVAVQADKEAYVDVKNQLNIPSKLDVNGTESAFLKSKSLIGTQLGMNSNQGVANVETKTLNLKKLSGGPTTNILADNAEIDVLNSKGNAQFQIKEEFALREAHLKKTLKVKAGNAQVGPIHAQEVAIQADKIKTTGLIETTQDVLLDGKVVQMEKGGSVQAEGKAIVRATQSYTDQQGTKIVGEKGTVLYIPQTVSFLGTISSNSPVELWLKDMGIENLLNQVKAPEIEAHLDSDVRIEKDLSVKQNLYLFAKSFENKAVILAPAGFVLHMVGDITNTGIMKGEQDLVLLTMGGDIKNTGQVATAGKLGIQGNSIFNEGALDGGQTDIVATTGSIISDGGKLSGREYLRAVAAGSIILKETDVSSSKGDISFEASNQIHFYAPHVDAFGNITVFGEKGVTVYDMHDFQRTETHTERKAGNIFEASRKYDSIRTNSTSKGAFFASQNGSVTLRSTQGDISVRNIHVKASQTILEALNGVVSILQGENESITQEHEKKEDLALINDKMRITHEVTHTPSSFSGSLTVKSKETIVEIVKGQTLDFLKDIEKNGGIVSHKIVENLLDVKEESHTAPTAALSAVVALAASICTAGVGGAIVGATSSMLAAAASSAISAAAGSLLTQASLALICCEGDIGKAAQRFASTESLKSVVCSALTAGVTQGISIEIGLPSQAMTFTEHLQKNLISSGTSAGFSMLIQGQDTKEALLQAAKNAGTGVIGGTLANTISKGYSSGDLNWVTHKVAHGALGAFTGAILGDNPGAGALAGALGGITAEIIADAMLPGLQERAAGNAIEKASSEGRTLSENDFQAAIAAELSNTESISRIGTALTAFVLDQDVNTAISTGTNAVQNNFVPLVLVGLSVASTLYSAYEVYNAYKEGGAEGALKELAMQGVIAVAAAGGGKLVFKVGAKVLPVAEATFQLILEQNPMLKMVFNKAINQASKISQAATNSKIGQAVTKAEGAIENLANKTKERFKQVISPKTANQNIPVPDYSAPEAAFYLRIDPHTGKGPMAIDTSLFAGEKTLHSGIRNKEQFWKMWNEKYPGMMSEQNLMRVQAGRSPHVDSQWVNHFPEHKLYMNQKLEHHHLDHNVLAVPLPKELHRGAGNKLIWHDK